MQFQSEIIVTGMKASKGNLEDGTAYDSTKVYVQTELDASRGNMKGFASAEYAFGKSDEYDKYKHLSFPFKGKATLAIQTNGKTQKTVIVAIEPVQVQK